MDDITPPIQQPPAQPVMDVQSPQPQVAPTPGVISPLADSTTVQPTAEDTISSEVPSGPVAPPASPQAPPDAIPVSSQVPSTSAPNPMAAPQKGVPKKKHTAVVILVALIVAIGLAAAAYWAYNKNKKTAPATSLNTSTTATSQAAVAPTVKASDVDQANQQIDKGLATTNDSKDFASSDLADATLGL